MAQDGFADATRQRTRPLEQAQQVQTMLAERWSFRPLIRDIKDMRDDAAASGVVW